MIAAITSYIIFLAIICAFIRNIARKNKQKAQKKYGARSNIQVKARSVPPQNIPSKPAVTQPNVSLASPAARIHGLDRNMFENRECDWLAKQIKEERINKGMFR